MPAKYHIHTSTVSNIFPEITRSGVIAWQEGCLRCAVCVKDECVYGVYSKRSLHIGEMLDSIDTLCKDCFRCVQNCPNRLIQKGLNPKYKALGDDYWTPEIISKLWYQAETGRIPVSGAGYGGTFSGPGFDSMWTDMSEIVRPTRDGIHGREYISTAIDLGRRPMALQFDESGKIVSQESIFVEIPLPIIFDVLPWSPPSYNINLSILKGAKEVGTLAIIKGSDLNEDVLPFSKNIVPLIEVGEIDKYRELLSKVPMVEIRDQDDIIRYQSDIKSINPRIVVAIRLSLSPNSPKRVLELTKEGAEVFHLVADEFGMEWAEDPVFIKDRMKDVHNLLVEEGIRDQVSILGGGGIAMAEHMAKLVICGADAVSIDIPLLIAMECRVCRRCKDGIFCPVELENVDPEYGGARIRNLMAGWHSQLLEVLGAMGMRDARRLRGEMGRAMFYEDLEKEFLAILGNQGSK